MTQIRYDAHDRRTQVLSKEQALGLDSDRKKSSIQELYFDLMKKRDDDTQFEDWDFVRVQRPDGDDNSYWPKQ
ncbi:MAG: hypothetical protein SGCHY_000781 [Lobulomycetales sp.]